MIFNRTRKTAICTRLEVASSHFQKARGLMFKRSLEGGMLLDFEKESRVGIWTLGMLFTIDIAWIDSQGRITKIKSRARPWRYVGWGKGKAVLEVNGGTLERTGTRVGDILKWTA